MAKPPIAVDCKQVVPNGGAYFIFFEKGKTDYLLIPTILMSGIECNEPPNAIYLPNYWSNALDVAKQYCKNLPTDVWIGLALNSANSRSQDQLHIHLCTLDAAVVKEIKDKATTITTSWQTAAFIKTPQGNLYNAMIWGDITKQNPFELVFAGTGGHAVTSRKADTNMLVAARPSGGGFVYYLLYNQDGRSAEELLHLSHCGS